MLVVLEGVRCLYPSEKLLEYVRKIFSEAY